MTIRASTSAGFSVPISVPNKASTVLNRKFCDSQPIVLKARVTPTEVPVDRVVASIVASISEVFEASTLMSPDEWFLMRDVEKLMGRTFPREVVPGFEPDVEPVQPSERFEKPKKQGRSVTLRRGSGTRRR